MDVLAELVAERVADGLRKANKDAKVVTLYELKRLSSGVSPSMHFLNDWMRVPVESAFTKMFSQRPPPLTRYVSPRIALVDGRLDLQLRFFKVTPKNGDSLEAVKLVSARRDEEATLLAGAREAARRLGQEDHRPIARIAGSARVAKVGVPFVLDGSSSSDEDKDEFAYEWRSPDPEIATTSSGATLTFVPTERKTYEFQLVLQQVQPSEMESLPKSFSVEALDEPQVTVGPSRPKLLEPTQNGQRPSVELNLEGTCKECDVANWIQTKGPVVAVPDSCSRQWVDGEFSCSVQVTDSGDYEFALVGSNPLKTVPAVQAFLVAATPIAVVSAPDTASVNHQVTLSGRASYEELNAPLRYRWNLLPKWNSSIRNGITDTVLATPSDSQTTFVPTRPGVYFVELCVMSSSEFGGRQLSRRNCDVKEVHAREPSWLPFALVGGDFSVKNRGEWLGVRLKLGTTVRWPSDHFGVRFEQALLRSTPSQNSGKSTIDFGGGTSLGVAWIPSSLAQAHLSVFGSTWGSFVLAPEAGIDLRLQRLLVLSGTVRVQRLNDDEWHPIATGLVGVGYDL